jgi:DNA polymerase I-like protein with 3'-5' exonuclease and polymerase domains
MKIYADVESVGLCGPVKLIQYAIDDGPVQFIPLFKGWEQNDTSRLLLSSLWERLDRPDTTLVAYNAAFDCFHLYRLFHKLKGYEYDSPERPVQPLRCKVLDLHVAATQRSPLAPFAYSKGASRSVAAVRRVPRCVEDVVATRVESALRPLLPRVVELKRHTKEVKGQKDMVTLCWTLDGRMSLKNLMQVYGLTTLKLQELWPLPEKGSEKPWLPYPDPAVHGPVELQCDTVMSDPDNPFWKYAELDIWFLKVLEEKLGYPEPTHHDDCTHIVAYTRYYGYKLDRDVLIRTKRAYAEKVQQAQAALKGINLDSPKQKLALLRQYDPLVASSSKKVIQVIAESDRPAAPVAKAMIGFTMYSQRLNQVEKVLECRTGRAHPTLRVMGTRTGRMAGEAGLNWQGIPQAKKGIGIRAAMEAAAVGDWSQFEVAIAAAAYPDEMIQHDLDNNIDAHTMNAVLMQPKAKAQGWTYERMKELVDAHDPLASSLRKQTKACTFGLQYFCQAQKVAEVLGVSLETGEEALRAYYERYRGFGEYKKRIENETQTADTEHWSRDSVKRMAREVTDMTGYRMRWDFEAKVAEALWQLGGTGIQTGKQGTIIRTKEKGRQTYDGAVKSALLGGAIAIQAAVSRQRGNALVQATGSSITKMLMANIWRMYRVPSLCIHDELVFADHPNFNNLQVQEIIDAFTSAWKPKIKSLHFDYKPTLVWADK